MIFIFIALSIITVFVILNEDLIISYLTYRLIKSKGFELIKEDLNYGCLIEKLFLNSSIRYYIKVSHLEEHRIIELKVYKSSVNDLTVYNKMSYMFENVSIVDVFRLRKILNNLR